MKMLNEIKCADAYNRFYSDVNQNTFNTVTFGSKNLLSISKFILDYFKGKGNDYGLSDITKIQKIGEIYKGLNNDVQVDLNNKAKSGNYSTLDDLYNDVIERNENSVKMEGLQYGKGGIIILCDDDELYITSTPTYESETKNYGWTKWCTASDMFGRYNGYYYFINYTMPFVTFYEDDEFEDIKERIDMARMSGPEHILVQVTFKKARMTYQIQVSKKLNFVMICDENDIQTDTRRLESYGDGYLEKIENAVSSNLELLFKAVQSNMYAEYDKCKEIYNKGVAKIKQDCSKIKDTVPSVIESLKSANMDYLLKNLLSQYDDDNGDYNWFNNLLYRWHNGDTESGNFVLGVYLGGNSNKVNDYIRYRDISLSPFICLISINGELTGYIYEEDKFLTADMLSIDGKIYVCAYDGNETLYDTNGNCIVEYMSRKSFNGMLMISFTERLEVEVNDSGYEIQSKNPMWLLCTDTDDDDLYDEDHITAYNTVTDNLSYLKYSPYASWYPLADGYVTFKTTDGKNVRIKYIDFNNDVLRKALSDGQTHMDFNRDDIASMVRECVNIILKNKKIL